MSTGGRLYLPVVCYKRNDSERARSQGKLRTYAAYSRHRPSALASVGTGSQKTFCCRTFAPAPPVYPAASLRDFSSGALTTGSMTTKRADFEVAPVPGGVLVGGGFSQMGRQQSAEVYNTKSGKFTAVGDMKSKRNCGVAASLKSAMSGIALGCD
jgi:hypothetical protein